MTEETIIPAGKKLCECGHCDELINCCDKQGREIHFRPGHNAWKDNPKTRAWETAPLKRCECGYCEDLIPSINKGGRPAKYQHGHNSKGKHCRWWKGGRKITPFGYVLVWKPDHPNASKEGYIFEHRLMMEEMIGRRLESHEVVHHKDGNKQNNSKDNLQLFDTNSQHVTMELTVDMSNRKCCDCGGDTVGRRWHTKGLPDGVFRCNRCYIRLKRLKIKNKKRDKDLSLLQF